MPGWTLDEWRSALGAFLMTEDTQKPKVKITTDSDGNPSTMRVLCIMSFLVAAIIGLAIGLDKAEYTQGKMDLVLYFLGGAFGGKVGQKYIEKTK